MLDRRQFLTAGGLAVCALTPSALARPRFDPRTRDLRDTGGKVLVVLQLSGGNDGLGTLLPIGQDAWFRARPTLSRTAQGAHDLAALPGGRGFALHPALGGLARAFGEGRSAAVQSAGYAQPNRSHFRSMEIWHTGLTPDVTRGESPAKGGLGWLGRAALELSSADRATPLAVHVGDGPPPLSLRSPGRLPASLARIEDLRLDGLDEAQRASFRALSQGADDDSDLAFLRRSARQAGDLAARLDRASARDTAADWPDTPLGRRLRLIATLIAGGLDASIYGLEHGSFDTHLDQGPIHANLLADLDRGLTAFHAELAAAGVADRVVLMAFSEFGRRVAENGTGGTDHGAAGPMLLLGSGLATGLHGTPPDLRQLEQGDLVAHTDFRAVHATLRTRVLGLPALPSEPEPLAGLFS